MKKLLLILVLLVQSTSLIAQEKQLLQILK